MLLCSISCLSKRVRFRLQLFSEFLVVRESDRLSHILLPHLPCLLVFCGQPSIIILFPQLESLIWFPFCWWFYWVCENMGNKVSKHLKVFKLQNFCGCSSFKTPSGGNLQCPFQLNLQRLMQCKAAFNHITAKAAQLHERVLFTSTRRSPWLLK